MVTNSFWSVVEVFNLTLHLNSFVNDHLYIMNSMLYNSMITHLDNDSRIIMNDSRIIMNSVVLQLKGSTALLLYGSLPSTE